MTTTAPVIAPMWARIPDALRAPMVVDIAIATATLAFAVVNDRFGDQGPVGTIGWFFDIALCVPLLWRRRQPLAVFAVISGIALLQWFADTPDTGPVAVLVALYAVGAYESRRWAIVAATAIALLGVVMAAFRWAPVDHRPTVIALLTGTVTAAWVTGVYARTRRAYLRSVLDRAATAERERDHQALLATAAERARISREMHDIIAHTLSVMVALSDGATMSVSRDAESARLAMEESSMLGRQALADLRRLLGGLNASDDIALSPTPGLGQLEELVGSVRAAGIDVELAMRGQPVAVPPGLQLAVYRLVQESLTNVLKHAPGATRAIVTLAFGPTSVDVDVVNDGPAVHVAKRADSPPGLGHEGQGATGRGIAGMRERAAVFGGVVEVGPTPCDAWRVSTRLTFDEGEGQV